MKKLVIAVFAVVAFAVVAHPVGSVDAVRIQVFDTTTNTYLPVKGVANGDGTMSIAVGSVAVPVGTPQATVKIAVSSSSSTTLLASSSTRGAFWIVNAGSQICYLDNIVATTNTWPIYPGASFIVTSETGAALPLFAIAASGTGDIRIIPIKRG